MVTLNHGIIDTAKAKAEARTKVIVVNLSAQFFCALFYGGYHRRNLRGVFNTRLPASAPLGRTLDRRRSRAANPKRHGALHRLGRDSCVFQAIVLAVKVHIILRPQSRHDLQPLGSTFATTLGISARGGKVTGERAAHAEGWQQPTVRQHVNSGAGLRHQHRVTQSHAGYVHAKLQALAAAG